MAKFKKIPKFKSENAEREFWAKHDIVDYVDIKSAKPVDLHNLKPSLRTISIRLPEHLIAELKTLSNERDIPYQALLKQLLAERVSQELRQRSA